jgi:hypothetical protein
MKRMAVVAVFVAGIVAAPAVVAADSGGKASGADPYAQAHHVSSPLGPLYGPVQAGPPSSASYGYITR